MTRWGRISRYERKRHLEIEDWRRDVDDELDEHVAAHESLRASISDVRDELRKIYMALVFLCFSITTGIIVGAIVALVTK